MALKIRLARGGAKNRPYYRVVVADSRMPRDGRFIERVGSYDPMLAKDDENRIILKQDRIEEWIGKGAKPTDRVAVLMARAGMGEMPAHPAHTKKNKPKAKAQQRLDEQAEREREAAEAAAAPAEEEASSEE